MRLELDVLVRANQLVDIAVKAIAERSGFSSAEVRREGLGEASVLLIRVSWRENGTTEIASTRRITFTEIHSLSVSRGNAQVVRMVHEIFEAKDLLKTAQDGMG